MTGVTPSVIAAVGAAFVVGVVVGAMLTEGVRLLTGRDDVADVNRRARGFVSRHLRHVAVALVTVSLAANAVVGTMQILTASRVAQEEARLSRLSMCLETYNVRTGVALTARTRNASAAAQSEIALWRELRAEIAREDTSADDIVASIDRHVANLHRAERSRDEVPFPPPNLCAEEVSR